MQLLCIGDVALADTSAAHQVWNTPQGMIPGDEVRILFNWELPIGDTINPVPRSSGPRILAHPDALGAIRKWSPSLATLATNHILDAGNEGLANTIEALNQGGFITVGAGRTREEATRPLFWETAEGRLAIVNWVFPETHPDWMAIPGPNCWPGIGEAKRIIQELKGKSDWVLVVPHWSDELFPYPRPEDRAIARQLVHMGADLIIGHHPHVVRGMENIGSSPVFYSTGNFYFSDISDGRGSWIVRQAPRNREGLGVQVSLQRGKPPEWRALSFWQTGGRAILDPLRRAGKRMDRVSRPLHHHQNSEYTAWYSVQYARFDKWGYRWQFGLPRLGTQGLIRYLLRLTCSRLHDRL